MPLGDGTYYQTGALYESGTAYVDALGQPVLAIGQFKSSREGFRLAAQVDEWVAAAKEGEQALLELETKRQQQRLKDNKVAKAYRDSDACAGGKWRLDCAPAQILVSAALEQVVGQEFGGKGESWALLTKPVQCFDCNLVCVAAAQLQNGVATGLVRFMNVKPSSD
jgi:hypothetical protein